MSQVIIYKQDNGVLAIMRPTEDALAKYGIEAIALKDVPEGKPFKIIDAADVPTDRTDRAFWTCDDEDLTDGVGAAWSTFPEVTQ
jgi:hypothetical protein